MRQAAAILMALALVLIAPFPAAARIVRITIESKQPSPDSENALGTAGPYETLTGHAFGEIDPKDPHNTIITDIDLAPHNKRGMVEYVATFTLSEPVELSRGNGVLLYAVPNRGHRITPGAYAVEGESGEQFLMRHGFIVLHSGWQGDIPPRAGMETIKVPIARNSDGSSITGLALARFKDMPSGARTLWLPGYHDAATLDTSSATLTKRTADFGQIIPIASGDWAFSDCGSVPFPGRPDPRRISVRDGFDPAYLYELTYTTKDPLVLGIGLAATRDIISFFRYQTDKSANPLAGHVTHAIGQGVSQSGNFVRQFIHLGFNQDEDGRIVWDGANPHIAGRLLPLNIRFGHPGGAAELYEPGSEGTVWWGDYTDAARGRTVSSLLDRSRATNSPKIIETFGSAEFWSLRMSPDLVGTNADQDIRLPANVRRYYLPGTSHGGGAGGFSTEPPDPLPGYELPPNPNPQAESMRTLLVMLTDWVTKDVAPPPSVYPRLADGQLVRPDYLAMGFPKIPGQPLPDRLINPFFNYDFGPKFNYQDLSGVITVQPPLIRGTLPMLVPRVDADGNETSGIPSVLLQAPLGTYLGWNVVASGYYKGHNQGFAGGFIPFEQTKAQRLAKSDPRPSLEERYHDHAGYVARVKEAVERLSAQRFLLPEDADRLVRQAEGSNVLR